MKLTAQSAGRWVSWTSRAEGFAGAIGSAGDVCEFEEAMFRSRSECDGCADEVALSYIVRNWRSCLGSLLTEFETRLCLLIAPRDTIVDRFDWTYAREPCMPVRVSLN